MFKNKEGKVRAGWKIAAVTGAMFSIIGIISFLISIIPTMQMIVNGDLNPITMEYSAHGKKTMELLNAISMVIQEVVFILTPLITWRFIMKRPLRAMGLPSLTKHTVDLLVGLLFGIVSMSFVFGAIVLSGNAAVETWTPHFSLDTVVYLFFFILVGFAEEIYGRGFIMSTLRQTKSIPAVMMISAVIFSIMHSANSGISFTAYLNIALVGLLFAYMYLKSGSIWMPIGYHITWNYFQGNVFGFKVSGLDTRGIWSTVYDKNTIFNGGEFGPEGGIFVTVIILLGFFFVRWYYKDKHFDFMAEEPETDAQGDPLDQDLQPPPM